MKIWAKPVFAAVLMLTAAGSVPVFAQNINLTLWGQGDCPPDACLGQALINGFEAVNPGITITRVQQPVDGYFTNLLAQSVIGRGPDIASMWAGTYIKQFKPYMVDLHKYVSDDIINSVNGISYFAEGYDKRQAVYAAPQTAQWYIGYYNKKVFADAGITTVPSTWKELEAASKLLKEKGYTPIIQGAADGGAQFASWEDWSYVATAAPLSEWGKFISGEQPYNDPRFVAQLGKWHKLYSDGYFNKDAFNYRNVIPDFIAGKVGMYLGGGSWQAGDLYKAMGKDVGVIVPPYSDIPQKSIISFAGGGYSVMNYSRNVDAAGKFAAFVLSDKGQAIIAKFDAPTRAGFATANPLLNDMANTSGDPKMNVYPMFDNFTQGPVTDALNRNIAQVLVGQITPGEALSAMDAAAASLPADQKQPISFGN